MNATNKPNTGFWVIAVIALLWNLMGLAAFLADTFMREAMMEGYTEAQLELMNAIPSWNSIFYGIATIGGTLASITMLMRKKITVMLFLISLVAVLVLHGYWLLGTDAIEVMGSEAVIMPILVILASIGLYFYSKKSAAKGWLN